MTSWLFGHPKLQCPARKLPYTMTTRKNTSICYLDGYLEKADIDACLEYAVRHAAHREILLGK
jgi:hypothetical protein